MVSFKSNNCQRDNTVTHCHHPGTLQCSLSHYNNNCNYSVNQGDNHDRTPLHYTPPRTIYHNGVPNGCQLHSRLDQPVTSSIPSRPSMDEKKIVQVVPLASPGQYMRTKSVQDGPGVVASISGARRKNGPQGLRSPAAKRPLTAPVSLQGWLHKQGSEGLMLWKRRWFVLSEYCLFYYKGPEEEKLLGSILLPSYCVTICKSEDKINKKFAFKAEHANMRTYHFAADSREIMNQWMNALTLATLLQDPNPGGSGGGDGDDALIIQEIADPAHDEHSARPSVSSISSIVNQSADDSDSGFHGFQSRDDPTQSNNNSSPNSINTASFPNLSASNSNHLIANNNNNNNNSNDNNNNNNPEKTLEGAQPQPLMNGWMQPPPQFSQPSTSQQQYSQIIQNSIQSQQHQQQQIYPQRQTVMHQRMIRQQHQHLIQHQQIQHPSASHVQTAHSISRNFGQPVYANAPPKPRRLTDGSIDYSTPSPDPDYRQSPVQSSTGIHMTTNSPIGGEYDRGNNIYAPKLVQHSIPPSLRIEKSGLNYGYAQGQPVAERRTPDTYGRNAKHRTDPCINGDYEDVYTGPQLYERPPGPVGYKKGAAPNPIAIPFHVQHGETNQQQVGSIVIAPHETMMRQPRIPPPRPHSADFLDYEVTMKPSSQTQSPSGTNLSQHKRPQRPKSSLDIVGPSEMRLPNGDGYFYSEERYAAQMRQSAVYLHQTPQHHQHQRNQSLSRATTPSKCVSHADDTINLISGAETTCPSVRRLPIDASVKLQHPMATQSLQRYEQTTTNEAMIRRSLRERNHDTTFHHSFTYNEVGTTPRRVACDYESSSMTSRASIGPHITYSGYGGHSMGKRSNDQQFARSASARLPRTRHPNAPDDSDENEYGERTAPSNSRDGERRIQQREESMKRLLEWKQRMLQSPLTRKPTGSANANVTAQSELSSYYKRQALLDLAAHEASVAEARHLRRRDIDSHRPHTRSKSSDGRRSAANTSRYSSYSSDDEAPDDARRKRTRRPSHTSRSPRQVSEDNAANSCGHDRNNLKGGGVTHQDYQPNTSYQSTIHSGIPPDAGYEEVSFPQIDNPTANRSKKPGILKTPSSYSNKQIINVEGTRLNTLAGYIAGESWQSPKNVQWHSIENKENWDVKIDESEVVKEFSYQYIKASDIHDENNVSRESINLVPNRIRSFESSIDETSSPTKEVLSMQEPLKISPSQAIEAHVARVDLSRNITSNIREFPIGDGSSEDANKNIEIEYEEKQNDGSKSVKDLLADFERKSQQVRRQEKSKREQVKHRGVFSDTETLLYDTGSDLDQPDKSEEEIDEQKENIDKKQAHMNPHNTNSPDKKDKKISADASLNDSQETIEINSTNIGTPNAFGKLSMTVLMVSRSDDISEKETAESIILNIDEINPEEHYLPMSPRKAILDPNNDERVESKMMESLFANLQHEECSYVEMTQNGIGHSLLAPNGDAKLDSGDYSALEASHYELVCVAGNKVEPVYMEVRSLTEKEENKNADTNDMQRKNSLSTNNKTQIRLDLPDILTALKSDSSDADDESSKDLDSLDAPRHPRFSLSDTFRPASYYLGASRTLIAELHDSSDSELVSPPPIPMSPPPMEDLNCLDMQSTVETKKCSSVVPVNRDSSQTSPMSWNKTATGQVEISRPPSRYSANTISSTLRDSRISLESASGSDSLELKNPEEEARHQKMKRRPVSDEVCEVLNSLDELESLGSRFDGASIDLDQYLEELQARDAFNVDLYAKDLSYNSIYGFNENVHVADKIKKNTTQAMSKIRLNSNTLDQPFHPNSKEKTNSVSSLPSIRVSDIPPSHQHSQSFTGDTYYENVVNYLPLRCSPIIPQANEDIRHELRCQKTRGHRHISHSQDLSYPIAFNGGSNSTSDNSQRPNSPLSTSIISPMDSTILPSHVNSCIANNQSTSTYNDPRIRNHSRSVSEDSVRYSLSPNHRSNSIQDSNSPPSTSAIKSTAQNHRNSLGSSYTHGNNRNTEQTHECDQTGAPYYYSDLQAGVSEMDKYLFKPTHKLIAHTSRLPQLNNQRGDSTGLNKRNDIGRLVNPITKQIPRRIEVEDIDEARRIAAELRKNSSQFLADNKSDLVDKRNFYEADTLRRVKSTDITGQSLPLPDVSTVNLYPHGLRDKSGSHTYLANGEVTQQIPQSLVQSSHRRSRSLEGLLDDVGLDNFVEQRNRANRVSSVPPTITQAPDDVSTSPIFTRINSQEAFMGEDPWEQDTLWRESLRRVSLRHARSLDNLDTQERRNENSPESRARPKITRGATYVNDSVVLERLASPDHTQERPRLKRRTEMENDGANHEDDGAYESLAMDRASGGYVWNIQNESYRLQSSQQNGTNHFLDDGNLPLAHQHLEPRSFELDREKLRQWDLLSSACLLQEQQRNSMAESGRGLPERQDKNHALRDDVSTMMITRMMEGQAMMMEVELKERKIDDKMRAEYIGKIENIGETITTDEKENGRASGSGSIIGRDPLPPRAVSTSQLVAENPLTQPPVVITTLPHVRVNGRERQRVNTRHLIHQSTSQSNTSRNNLSGIDDNASSIDHSASINDVRASSTILNDETSSESNQRLGSPSRNLRIISPMDHRVSSPSESERHIHSPNERNLAASPICMREINGDNGSLRKMHRTSTIPKQKSVTSESESRAESTTTGSSSRLVQVSAGELLGRTHEELVLLLIQLRRQSAVIGKAMETCHMEIEAQARLADLDAPSRLENLQKLEELKKHLMNLEKQYEKGKPLVNLVDNMVKLGSLYNRNGVNSNIAESHHDLIKSEENAREHRDRVKFNQRVQEQRLLADERRDWERLSSDHGQLQAKVHQLYKLDRLLQEESGTLHNLQQDKEILEKALGGLRHKLQDSNTNPVETERYRKQQILIERELSRIRMLLAHNSKKLEETVAENARLEQDLVVLRQKLQASRRYTGNITKDSSGTTAVLEVELRRVQQLVGDLQRQRQELSIQVRQLTEKSHSLVQQIKPNDPPNVLPFAQIHYSKKRAQSSWLETDLDSGMTFDHGLTSPSSSTSSMSPCIHQTTSPHLHITLPQYKDPPLRRFSPVQSSRSAQSNNQSIYVQPYSRSPSDSIPSHNDISALSPQLRAQIQQHQLKHQLLKDQMQGKASPVQTNVPLYVNTDSRRSNCNDNGMKHVPIDSLIANGMSLLPPEYIPPPPPPPPPLPQSQLNDETPMMNGNCGQYDDNNKMHNREKQEIKTVRIVKRESERRQRDRGDKSGNIGIPLISSIQAPGGAKRISNEEFGSQQFDKSQLDRVAEETAIIHAQSTIQLSELDDIQFQRSMSLPRGFGGQRLQPGIHNGSVHPPPRSDSMNALRNMMVRRHRARIENANGTSDGTPSLYTKCPTSISHVQMSSPNYAMSPPYSPNNHHYVSPYTRSINQSISSQHHTNDNSQHLPIHPGPLSSERTESIVSLMSPSVIPPVPNQQRERLTGSVTSINGLKDSPQLSPVFKSEAAKQIIKEMTEEKCDSPRRRLVPKEMRRHYTVSSSKPMLDLEDNFSKMEIGRARDDLDMERALRPRMNAPDVVRSTLSHKELKYNESTIDQLLGTPNKIVIPERYIPEYTPELSIEEKKLRLKKADAIRKMLSETTIIARDDDEDNVNVERTNSLKKKVAADKRQRDHILQLNQILAKQVMEKSKMVAVKALTTLPLNSEPSLDDDDLSPTTPLPLYQQRDNFYS